VEKGHKENYGGGSQENEIIIIEERDGLGPEKGMEKNGKTCFKKDS